MKGSVAFFAGAGLGILIGLLIGMTTSGVAGLIAGTLTASLLVLLGYKEKGDIAHQAIRVGAFGLFCVVGILGGLYLRVTNAFAIPVDQELNAWLKDSIFTPEEAKAYTVYNKFAILPKGAVIDTTKDLESGSTVLYSVRTEENDCDKAAVYASYSLREELKALQLLGGVWERYSLKVQSEVPQESQKELLAIFRESVCND